jgi:hypothetical protein
MAAVAGMVLVKNPDLTEAQVRDILKNACRKTGGYVYDANGKSAELGWGVIDMFAAVTLAGGTDPGEPAPGPTHNIYGVVSSPATALQGDSVNINYSVIADKPMDKDTAIGFSLAFKRPDGSSSTFYNGAVTIPLGQTMKSGVIPHTISNTVSGACQFVMTVDPNFIYPETNEADNVAFTSINVTSPAPPTQAIDIEVTLTGYEWLDATRVKIGYRATNRGSATITNWKAVVGFIGKAQLNWDRNDIMTPGQSRSGGTVWTSSLYGTMPATFKIQVVSVNGLPDENTANNVATLLINK